MCFTQFLKSLSMKNAKNSHANIEQQLSNFDISYWELKLSRKYTNRQFASLFIKALENQGIDIESADASVVEKALLILAAYFLQVHIGNSPLSEGCQDENAATYKLKLMTANRQIENDAHCEENALRKYITQIQDEISAALVVISLEHPNVLYYNIMDELIRMYDIPWSFDSFASAVDQCLTCEEVYAEEPVRPDYFSIVGEVWKNNLCVLICNATEDSLELLSSVAEREALPECAWHEFFWEYFEEHLRYFSDEIVFEMVPKIFPEMMPVILQFAMFDAMWGVRWRSMSFILQRMEEYQKYDPKSAIFDIETYWDKLITVLISDDMLNIEDVGVELENVVRVLIETFKIPEEDIQSLIEYSIGEYMLTDKAQTAAGVMHLIKLLPCKVAYDYIERLNPHIILATRLYLDIE